jgi:hypothetical protein
VLRTSVATALATVVTAASVLASAAPVWARSLDDGEHPGSGLSVLQTIGIFVCIPLGAFVLISLLVLAPSMARGPRYRPGLGWWAAPVWFNGPENADAAVRDAVPTPSKEGGGASARW